MNIKTYMAIAVAALTAACSQEAPEVQATDTAPAVELNDDGSVKTETDNAEAASMVAPVGQQHQP